MSAPFKVLFGPFSPVPKTTKPHAKRQETLNPWFLLPVRTLSFSHLFFLFLGGYVVQCFHELVVK